jgi:hypothetical protein
MISVVLCGKESQNKAFVQSVKLMLPFKPANKILIVQGNQAKQVAG